MKSTIIDYFISLVSIDSESKSELETALQLEKDLKALGADVKFDNANKQTGGNIGNLYAYFQGTIDKKPILFCSHMDTVKPGNDIKPRIVNGFIKSDGTTVLGSDDKSGIAEIVWAIKELKEKDEDHAPIEVLFTISEEIGLLGAKYLDYSMIKSKTGYALDSHKIGEIVIGAPSQNSMKYIVHGKEAHAGAEPENGVNAIKIASEAISKMTLGRIDDETTCNIGLISGGQATNIIPNKVIIEAESRSHDPHKLKKITDEMSEALQSTIEKYNSAGLQTSVEIEIENEYSSFRISKDDPLVILSEKACKNIGLTPQTVIGGGGSDVNIFNANGLKMAVAGTGMDRVHTVKECIRISDLENGAKWVREIIREYSKR